MENNKPNAAKIYFIAMAAFWFVFGMITTFYPALMNMFQTETGISAVTIYSDHIWRHDGFIANDIKRCQAARVMVSSFLTTFRLPEDRI